APRPRLAAQAELERAERALASVQRLAHGLAATHAIARAIARHLPHAVEELEGFWDGEVLPALAHEPGRPAVARGRVPARAPPADGGASCAGPGAVRHG